MSKRGPQSTLNHLNWNESEEPEEMGEFTKASDDVIKQRVIKKARRRMAGDDADSTAPAPASAFGSFKGFASTQLNPAGDKAGGAKPFAFVANLGAAAKTNGNGTATVSSSGGSTVPMFSFGSNASTTATADAVKKTFTFGSPSSLKADSTDGAKIPAVGFGMTPLKDTGTDSNKNLFSFATSSTTKLNTDDTPAKPLLFGSIADKTAAAGPEKKFTFGSPTTGTTKATLSFGSVAAKSDSTELEKKTPVFGSLATSKDTLSSPAKNMFSLGSNASKSDRAEAEKKSFTFGSVPPATKQATVNKNSFSFGSNPPKFDTAEPSAKKSFTFGSPKDTVTPAPKAMFSFGSNAPKADSTEGEKKTFSFGSVPPTSNDKSTVSTKTTFSFGSLQPTKNSTTDSATKSLTFGAPSFSFGVPTSSKQDEPTAADKNKNVFGAPKENSTDTIKKMFSFASPAQPAKTDDTTDANKKVVTFAPLPPKHSEALIAERKRTFDQNVANLNRSFVAWVSKKVKENAYCKLQPVFRDYEKHFGNMKQDSAVQFRKPLAKKGAKKKIVIKQNETPPPVEKEPEKPTFSFGAIAKEGSSAKAPTPAAPQLKSPTPAAPQLKSPTPAAGFSFGSSKPFSFGSPIGGILTSTAGATGGISSTTVSTSSPSFFPATFGSKPSLGSGGFTFGNVAKLPATESGTSGADGETADDDEPPKVEFTPVEEKDSLYSKRCKLFVKAGGSYSDRGVGTVHIKRVDGKVQVLVRADTSLGNVLLNIILNDSVPLQRMGKNNVMMICLPTPDAKPPPTSVLLRVKTAEEADELHETLLKYKPK